jgi:hypothetical protein
MAVKMSAQRTQITIEDLLGPLNYRGALSLEPLQAFLVLKLMSARIELS